MFMLAQMRRAVATVAVTLRAVAKLHMRRIIARYATRATSMHNPPRSLQRPRLKPHPSMTLL